MMHAEPSPLAGKTVSIAKGDLAGSTITIEDWWDRIAGKSWMHCNGNPTCLAYAARDLDAPLNDDVVYGKIGMFGVLVHVTFLEGGA